MKKDALHELISSMDKSEKRYFTLYITLHTNNENNNALTLFNAIRKMKTYTNEQLLKLPRKKPSDIQHLRAAKQYLYRQILKSMRAYRSEKSVKAQLKSMLSDVEFLYEKELHTQCEKTLSKAKKLATKYENHLHLLECLNWEIKLTQQQYFNKKSTRETEHIFGEILETINIYKNIKEYQYPIALSSRKSVQEGSRRKEIDKNIISQPLFENESKAFSFKALYFYYLNYSAYFYSCNDFEKALMYIQKSVELFELHPHQKQEESNLYLSSLRNTCIRQLQFKKYKDVPLTIKKIKAIPTKLKQKEQVVFDMINNLELNLYLNTGEFDKGEILAEKIKLDWESRFINTSNSDLGLVLSYNIACTYFGANNFTTANNWLNKIFNNASIDFRSDILCSSQLLHLIIHYEKNNENYDNKEYIEYRVKTANRFIKNRNRLYQFEKAILNFFKQKSPAINTGQERINSFKVLKRELETIIKNPLEKKALDYFDFISWIDSKIEGRTFAEIVKRNAPNY